MLERKRRECMCGVRMLCVCVCVRVCANASYEEYNSNLKCVHERVRESTCVYVCVRACA